MTEAGPSTSLESRPSGTYQDPHERGFTLDSPEEIPSVIRGTLYNLTICSATNPERDGSIFSDFMGYSMALREAGAVGDFYSCFPLDKHFDWLYNEHKMDAVRFGVTGAGGKDCIYSYTRRQHIMREYWFEEIDPMQLKQRVVEWIADKARIAKAHDTVNIFHEGHGNKDSINLGKESMTHLEIQRNLDAFAKEVQVNMITGACSSSQTAALLAHQLREDRYYKRTSSAMETTGKWQRNMGHRIRNANVYHAFVQSLARVKLPGLPKREVNWIIDDFERIMTEKLIDSLLDNQKAEPFITSHTSPPSGILAVEDMILKYKRDVIYDPKTTARRRRMEWPTADRALREKFRDIGEASHTRTEEVTQRYLELASRRTRHHTYIFGHRPHL